MLLGEKDGDVFLLLPQARPFSCGYSSQGAWCRRCSLHKRGLFLLLSCQYRCPQYPLLLNFILWVNVLKVLLAMADI